MTSEDEFKKLKFIDQINSDMTTEEILVKALERINFLEDELKRRQMSEESKLFERKAESLLEKIKVTKKNLDRKKDRVERTTIFNNKMIDHGHGDIYSGEIMHLEHGVKKLDFELKDLQNEYEICMNNLTKKY
jgi:hypothetical protein